MPIVRLNRRDLPASKGSIFAQRTRTYAHKQSRKNNSRFATRDELRGRIYPRRHWQNFYPICNARQLCPSSFSLRIIRSYVPRSSIRSWLDSIKWHSDVLLWRVICHTIRLNVIVWLWNERLIGRILDSEKGNYFQIPRESRSMDKFLRRIKMRLSFILTTSTHTQKLLSIFHFFLYTWRSIWLENCKLNILLWILSVIQIEYFP